MRYYKQSAAALALLIGLGAWGCAGDASVTDDRTFGDRGTDSAIPPDDLGLVRLIPTLVDSRGIITTDPSPPAACAAERVVFEMPRGKVGRFARFAPDGRSLALQIAPADGTSNGSLVRMDTCTGALASLVDDAPQQSAPVYSPDGNQIYYTWGHTPSDSSIRVMGSFGGNVAVVLDVFGAMMPEVSPDGSTLVYRINGGNLQLYGLAGGNDPNELPFSGYSARFSPDGARLVFTEPAGDAMHVIVYDLRTGTTFQLATVDVSMGYFAGVDFTANGTAVVVTSDVGTELIGINGGRRPLDSATGWVDVSADDRSVALLDHDRLVLLRDAI